MAQHTPNCTNAQRGMGAPRGFTIMDLLVSIVVVAILIAILLPALGKAIESTRRVVCQNNLRQIGQALHNYADDHFDQFPHTVHADYTHNGVSIPRPEETIFVRVEETNFTLRNTNGWDGLGLLLHPGREAPYLSNHLVLYCPSHTGDHDAADYAEARRAPEGRVAGNYQYRLPIYEPYRDRLDPAMALVSDGLREQSDYNHIVGNNILKVDASVTWFDDANGALYNSLVNIDDTPAGASAAADARHVVSEAWDRLDQDPARPVSQPPKSRNEHDNGVSAGILTPGARE